MSLRFQPERNIVICGLPAAEVEQVGREVALRTRRQFVDLHTDARRRRAATRRRFWPGRSPSSGEGYLKLALDQSLQRSGQVIALSLGNPVEPDVLQTVRSKGYIVYIAAPSQQVSAKPLDAAPGEAAGPSPGDLLELQDDCDLYLGPQALPRGLPAKLIIHCFYS